MIRINLAPTVARRRGIRLTLPSFNLGVAFGLVYLLAALGVGLYWWSLSADEARLNAEIDRASKELATLKATIGAGAKLKEQAADLRKRVGVIDELTRNQTRPIRLLDAFAGVVPGDLWITGFEERGTTLRVSGSAFTSAAIADFMANLRSSGKFKDVDLLVSRQDLAKTPSHVIFEITCRFEA
jgi:type IV pilus assembly protein PilN